VNFHAGENDGITALYLATYGADKPEARASILKLLLGHGANPHTKSFNSSRTPLHHAAEYGLTDAVNILIDHRADIEAKDRENWTPIFFAVQYNRPKVVKALLAAGANPAPNGRILRTTAMRIAKDHKNDEIIKMLRPYF